MFYFYFYPTNNEELCNVFATPENRNYLLLKVVGAPIQVAGVITDYVRVGYSNLIQQLRPQGQSSVLKVFYFILFFM